MPVRGARSATSDASPVDTVTTPVRPRPTPRPSRPGAGDQLRLLEQLVEVVAHDDTRRIEGGVRRPVLAREAAAVRDGRVLRLARPADLDREDRLADLEGPVREGEEPLRAA